MTDEGWLGDACEEAGTFDDNGEDVDAGTGSSKFFRRPQHPALGSEDEDEHTAAHGGFEDADSSFFGEGMLDLQL